jgi:hypothetical protein
MGGSGGRGWYSSPPTAAGVEKAVSDATTSSEYEAEANAYLQNLLSSYNTRDVEAIQKHLEVLEAAITKDIDGETSILFGGSVRKHTYVDGLSDVDVLMVVNGSSLAACSPQDVLAYFAERIKTRLPNTEVNPGALAITVKYTDGTELQVLPALRTQAGVRIASLDNSGWSNVVRPQEFATRLTEVNHCLQLVRLRATTWSRWPLKRSRTTPGGRLTKTCCSTLLEYLLSKSSPLSGTPRGNRCMLMTILVPHLLQIAFVYLSLSIALRTVSRLRTPGLLSPT